MISFWKGRNVFITGASGLVGSWLVEELLKRKAKPICLVRDHVPDSRFIMEKLDRKCTIINGDLDDYETLARAITEYEPETLFHLGAQTQVGIAQNYPIATLKANVEGTWNLLEACRKGKNLRQIVVASSDKAYGAQKKLPYVETMPLEGKHPYDCSKSCTDLISQMYARSYDLPITIARCGNIFGGGDLNFKRLIPETIKCLHDGTEIAIRSDGKFVRDYIYVKDVVSAYLTLVERTVPELFGEAFNFSYEQPMSVLEMLSLIEKTIGKKVKMKILNEAKYEIREQYLSAEKARKYLNWQPKHTLKQGMNETVRWYSRFFEG